MPSSEEYHIRAAGPHDAHVVLELVKDLATYEREPDAVKATPELLFQNMFGPTPYAHALLAYTGTLAAPGEPIGLALFFFNFSTWTGRPGLYLEDLYVKPRFRRLGVGRAFFRELGRVALEKNCGRLDWAVLKWNTPSIQFYESALGAKEMNEWQIMRLEEEGIAKLASGAV